MAYNNLVLKAANDVLDTINEFYAITKNLYGGSPNVNYGTFTEGLDKPASSTSQKTNTQANTSNVTQTTVEQAAQEALDSIDDLEQTETSGQKLRTGINRFLQGAGNAARQVGSKAREGMHKLGELAHHHHHNIESTENPGLHEGIERGIHGLLHAFTHGGGSHAVASAGHGAGHEVAQHASTLASNQEMLPQLAQYISQVAPELLHKIPQLMQMVMVPGATQ